MNRVIQFPKPISKLYFSINQKLNQVNKRYLNFVKILKSVHRETSLIQMQNRLRKRRSICQKEKPTEEMLFHLLLQALHIQAGPLL